MRGGAYDKAASALEAVRKAVPDWKGSDEFALIDKALRYVAFGKGGPVRERYEELKERQQYAARLKKALAQAKAKPSDRKLQFQVAAYYAALDRWTQALDAFIAGSSPACAAAAKLEKESAPPAKIADAWWSALDVKPDFLSSAIRAHAAALYAKALADPSFVGLPRVAADRRIHEYERSLGLISDNGAKSASTSSTSILLGTAKCCGVELVGNVVKDNKGMLSCFANSSYARIKEPFDPKGKPFEIVVTFITGKKVDGHAGVLCPVVKYSFAPLYINAGKLTWYASSSGKSWNMVADVGLGLELKPETEYQIKIIGKVNNISFYLKELKRWKIMKSFPVPAQVVGGDMQFGVDRVLNSPFSGSINLSQCYICVDNKLWWEGVRGSYTNVNKGY